MKLFFLNQHPLVRRTSGLFAPVMVMMCVSAILFFGTNTLAQVKRVSLSEMVAASGTVVTGRVVGVREGRHPNYTNIVVTFVTVEVSEMLKGAAKNITRHEFMQFGGTGLTRIQDMPSYRVGEDIMLFLYPESEQGFTSPVGGGQGKFQINQDTQTGERSVNQALPNARLFDGLKTQKLTTAERALVRRSETAMDYRAFSSLVKRLARP
jgi:hypothetical protein